MPDTHLKNSTKKNMALLAHGPNLVTYTLLLLIVITCGYVNAIGVNEISLIDILLLLAHRCFKKTTNINVALHFLNYIKS